MRLESGPARMDSMQLGIFALACLGFSAYFFYDWKWGYLEKNREKARLDLTSLLAPQPVPAQLGDRPTHPDFDALLAAGVTSYPDVVARLGPPKHEKNGTSLGDIKYFFSDYGMATITVRGDTVKLSGGDWKKWEHEKGDVDGQYYWGVGSGIVGLWVVFLTLKAATLRVTIDDAGMRYGSKFIPFDAMTRLAEYKKKGLCSLFYKDAGGQERRLRIDSYKIAKFEEIVDALCAARGFPNPRPQSEPSPTDEDEKAGAA